MREQPPHMRDGREHHNEGLRWGSDARRMNHSSERTGRL
jgi:hypothetical protein